MNDSNKITIIGIAINATLNIVWMVLTWFLNKKSIQATLQSGKPAAKPKTKRRLTVAERRFLRIFRVEQVFVILIIITEPYGYLLFNSFPPASKFELISLILSLSVMVGFTIVAILTERIEIRQIKSGEFMKRIKRTARERKKENVRICK